MEIKKYFRKELKDMEIENTKESTVIVFKNNSVFIGVYIVPLFIIVPLIISKITVQSIIMSLIVFTYLNIGNYIAMRNIGSIETITLKNESLIIRRLMSIYKNMFLFLMFSSHQN